MTKSTATQPDSAPAKRRPKVSILLITYNHGKYIGQAIESILAQETEYDYEINVIEDCSTDNTQEVVMRYVEKYPDKVKPYFNEKNIGYKVTQKNFVRGFKTMNGEYMAILEGDDYWNSPHKMQKQISFLEANPDFVACAHNVIKIYEGSDKEPHRFLYWPGRPEVHTVEDLIMLRSYFHTTTLMYRNVFNGIPPKQFENPWSCDIFNTIAHVQFGKLRYFDEDMSVYRAHEGGRFSNMKTLEGWYYNIGGLRRYNAWLNYRYLKTFSLSIVTYCNVLLRDKGKEAAIPPWYQRLKYIGIRAMYRIIYFAMCVYERTPVLPLRLKQNILLNPRNIWLYLTACMLCLLYPLRLALTTLLTLLSELAGWTYANIRDHIPESLKQRLQKLETTNKRLATLRRTVRRRKLFSRRGLTLVILRLIKRPARG